jgi:hypothetical protein
MGLASKELSNRRRSRKATIHSVSQSSVLVLAMMLLSPYFPLSEIEVDDGRDAAECDSI